MALSLRQAWSKKRHDAEVPPLVLHPHLLVLVPALLARPLDQDLLVRMSASIEIGVVTKLDSSMRMRMGSRLVDDELVSIGGRDKTGI